MRTTVERWGRMRTFALLGALPGALALLARLSLMFPLSHVGRYGRAHTDLMMLLAGLSLGFSLVAVPLLAVGLVRFGRWRRAVAGVVLYVAALFGSFEVMRHLW